LLKKPTSDKVFTHFRPGDFGTLKASLMDMPGIEKLTEKESAHPSQRQLDKLTK
jgi:hypothetical protein